MQILSFIDEHSTDKMKQEIENNYKQIKLDIVNIEESEMERIKSDLNLQHLVQQEQMQKMLFFYMVTNKLHPTF